jgi:hypothetical protein
MEEIGIRALKARASEEVHYVDHQTRDQLSLQSQPGASGLLLICLPTNYAEAETLAR